MSPSAITPNRYLLSFALIRFFNPFYLLGIYSLAAVYRLYHASPRALCNFVIIAVINILPLVRARQCNSFYKLLLLIFIVVLLFSQIYKYTCELKVCTTKKPENPSVFLTLPVAHELSVLCMI